MANYDKRLEALEKAASLGRYDDGQCRCGSATVIRILDCLDKEPEPVEPDLCERCGRPKERTIIRMVYDDAPNPQQLQEELIQPSEL